MGLWRLGSWDCIAPRWRQKARRCRSRYPTNPVRLSRLASQESVAQSAGSSAHIRVVAVAGLPSIMARCVCHRSFVLLHCYIRRYACACQLRSLRCPSWVAGCPEDGVLATGGLPSIAEAQCPARTTGSSTPTSGPTRAALRRKMSANCRRMQCNKPREQLVSKLTRSPHRWSRAATVAR